MTNDIEIKYDGYTGSLKTNEEELNKYREFLRYTYNDTSAAITMSTLHWGNLWCIKEFLQWRNWYNSNNETSEPDKIKFENKGLKC